ncbi:MAG TPA: adenylate/guanylate cyclase domain-containing protein [Solirubrobacteraceae bacterium]|nr:adenylate/guanylate cyclase domain-containing protein [Solirubrobacteraceae bacterium]
MTAGVATESVRSGPDPRVVLGRLVAIDWAAGGAGALVVFVAIGFLIPLFVGLDQLTRIGLVNAPLVVVYLLGSGLLITKMFARRVGRTLSWVREDRPPTEREHEQTLRLATYAVKLDAVAWIIAGAMFGLLDAALFSWGVAALVAGTIWLGGETTCALDYLLYERALRPVTAFALAARPRRACVAPGVRARLAMAWSLGTGVPLLGLIVVGIAGIAKPGVHTSDVAGAVLFLAGVAWSAGLLVTLLAAKAIADPLLGVRQGMDQIERGDLDAHVAVDDGSEVGLLQAGFNQMVDGLRERERIRDLFGRQVGEDVARAALSQGVQLGGEEREIAAVYIDLVGFTSLSLSVPPADVVKLLNRFFCVVIDVVEGEGGMVNKFEGDAALCVFGAPVARENATDDALRAARKLAARVADELPEVDFGIGISAGPAVAGNVGAEHRFEYTVIGDPVNEAARLAELAKQRAGRVLASDAALDRAPRAESDGWSMTEITVLRGRSAPTRFGRPAPRPS